MLNRKNSLSLAREIHQEMIDFRRDFHMYPEIGFEVHRTAALVAQQLDKYGLIVKTGVGRTGVTADLVIPGAKKTIAFRADMDALPIEEMNDIPYKSRIPLCAHMCGHDAHTSILLGAAKILTSLKSSLSVNVRFIFQPSEEAWPGGASAMIQDGVLEGVDEIYALHVWPTLSVGHYGVCLGPAMAQPDAFDITITGQGCHAGAPHQGVDPIIAASQLIQSLQTIVSRNINPDDSTVLTVTQIHAGTCYNVIPDTCVLTGTVRTYSKETQKYIVQRMNEMVRGIAQAHHAEISLSYREGYPMTYNHESEAEKVVSAARGLVGTENVDFPARKVMFGEDFAYYTQIVKGCFIHLGCRNEAKNCVRMLHDSEFNIDEDCLVYGAALFVELAMNESVNENLAKWTVSVASG